MGVNRIFCSIRLFFREVPTATKNRFLLLKPELKKSYAPQPQPLRHEKRNGSRAATFSGTYRRRQWPAASRRFRRRAADARPVVRRHRTRKPPAGVARHPLHLQQVRNVSPSLIIRNFGVSVTVFLLSALRTGKWFG